MPRWARTLAIGAIFGLLPLLVAPPAGAQTPCPEGVSVSVLPPDAKAPTTVNVRVEPTEHFRAIALREVGPFTLHYFVDGAVTPAGEAVPTGDPRVIATSATSQRLGLLGPGAHTVTVVLAQSDGIACAARGATSFIVGQQAGQPIAPQSGNAGLAGSSTAAATVVLLVGAAAAVVIAARLWTTRGPKQ